MNFKQFQKFDSYFVLKIVLTGATIGGSPAAVAAIPQPYLILKTSSGVALQYMNNVLPDNLVFDAQVTTGPHITRTYNPSDGNRLISRYILNCSVDGGAAVLQGDSKPAGM